VKKFLSFFLIFALFPLTVYAQAEDETVVISYERAVELALSEMLALQDNLYCLAIIFVLLRMAGIISHLVAMARELKSDHHSFTSRIT
jgi:hypothetical protein